MFRYLLVVALMSQSIGCGHTIAQRPMAGNAQAPHPIVVRGRVVDNSLHEAVGISVAGILPDGKLVPQSDIVIDVERDGHYRIQLAAVGKLPFNLLVHAENARGFGMVVVPTHLMVDRAIFATPIDATSTAEAQIYLTALGAGLWPSDLGFERLHGFLSATMARELLAANPKSGMLAALARGVASGALTWRAVLTVEGAGVQQAQLRSTYAALDWSHYVLSEGLTTAQSHEEEAQVRADYAAGLPLTYGLAAIRPLQLAAAAQGASEAFTRGTRLLPGALQVRARQASAMTRARYITALVNEQLDHEGAPSADRKGGRSLAMALVARLNTISVVDPAAAHHGMQAAWQAYVDAVKPLLRPTDDEHWSALQSAAEDLAARCAEAIDRVDPSTDPAQQANQIREAFAALYAGAQVEAQNAHLNPPAAARNLVLTLAHLSLAER